MLADWPKYDENLNFSIEAAHMESVMNAIRSIRNRRAEMNVPPSKKSTLYVVSDKGEIFRQGTGFICRLAYADQVIICDSDPEGHENMVCVVTNDAKLYIPLEELIDFEKELARIERKRRTASSRSPCSKASFQTKRLSPAHPKRSWPSSAKSSKEPRPACTARRK